MTKSDNACIIGNIFLNALLEKDGCPTLVKFGRNTSLPLFHGTASFTFRSGVGEWPFTHSPRNPDCLSLLRPRCIVFSASAFCFTCMLFVFSNCIVYHYICFYGFYLFIYCFLIHILHCICIVLSICTAFRKSLLCFYVCCVWICLCFRHVSYGLTLKGLVGVILTLAC